MGSEIDSMAFKVNELLKDVKLEPSALKLVDQAVASVVEAIRGMPDSVVGADAAPGFVRDLGVPADKIEFTFKAPESTVVAGSHSIRSIAKPDANVDVLLRMPKKCFLEKDYLNHRYHARRCLYLLVIKEHLKSCPAVRTISWSTFQNEARKPVLLVFPALEIPELPGFFIRIIPSATSVFNVSRMSLIRNNVRAANDGGATPTPGLVEGGYVNEQALEIIKRFLLNKTIDVLIYVDRLDSYRVDNLDRQVIKAITDSFGKAIWKRGLVVLTHAYLSPPDGLSYEDFFTRRSEALLKIIRLGAKIRKQEYQDSAIPIALVENTGKCATNEGGEKVLPDGTIWIPNLVKTITEIVLNGSKSIAVDQKLIDGPNPNQRGKIFIPLILALQYFFLVKPIKQRIREDIAREAKPLWELRDMGLANGKF